MDSSEIQRKAEKDRLSRLSVVTESGCWEWQGSLHHRGYGQMYFRGKCARKTHRVAWIVHNGDIPSGMCVLHRCDNRKCINPGHLFLGTFADNTHDAMAKGRLQKGERNGMSALTERQVRVIRARYADGAKQKKLAQRFGVRQSAISRVVTGARWAA